MDFNFDVVVHVENARLEGKIDHLLSLVQRVLKGQRIMSGELDALQAQVERNTTVTGSAIVLLNGIKAELDAAIAAADWPRVMALTQSLGNDVTALADAVAANTPAAP